MNPVQDRLFKAEWYSGKPMKLDELLAAANARIQKLEEELEEYRKYKRDQSIEFKNYEVKILELEQQLKKFSNAA